MQNAPEVLAFAAEDWSEQTGSAFSKPRSIDELKKGAAFQNDTADAVVAAVPFDVRTQTAE